MTDDLSKTARLLQRVCKLSTAITRPVYLALCAASEALFSLLAKPSKCDSSNTVGTLQMGRHIPSVGPANDNRDNQRHVGTRALRPTKS